MGLMSLADIVADLIGAESAGETLMWMEGSVLKQLQIDSLEEPEEDESEEEVATEDEDLHTRA